MDEGKISLIKNWLIKASHVLESAKALSLNAIPLLDTAIYHTQQSSEKAIKAFPVFKDQTFEKTHDIEILLNPAAKYDKDFDTLLDKSEDLTPYAILYRYPGDVLEPSVEEFNIALKAAEEIFLFVLSKMPADISPKPDLNTEK